MSPFGLFSIVTTIVFVMYLFGVHHLLTLKSADPCDMTFMFQYPQFVKIPLAEHITKAYPQYGLYAYGEGHITSDIRSGKFMGVPVLFVPGSAGSYKQARSLASVSLRKALNANSIFHLDFFTVNLNEEYSGLSGHVLKTQTEFLRYCVHRITKLYRRSDDSFTSLLVVGHSMGGLITKGLFVDPDFAPNRIKAIVTLATPHVKPIMAFDSQLSNYYRDVEFVWRSQRKGRLENITMASIGGGDLDLIVRSGLTFSWEADVSTTATAVPTVWRSVDHLSIAWCKQLILVLVRMLFDLVDGRKGRVVADPQLRRDIVEYHLVKRDAGKHFPGQYLQSPVFDKQAEWSEILFGQWNDTSDGKDRKNFMFRLNENSPWDMLTIRAIHFFHRDWLFACKTDKELHGTPICSSGENLSNYTFSIPTLHKQWKGAVIPLRPLAKQGYTHILARFPKTLQPNIAEISNLTNIVGRTPFCLSLRTTTMCCTRPYCRDITPWSVFADAHSKKSRTRIAPPQLSIANIFKANRLFRVLIKSDYRALKYTIEFPDLKYPWHAATLYVHHREECPYDASAKMFVPWSKEGRVAYISKSRKDYLTVGVGSPCPTDWAGDPVKVDVHLDPRCVYSISVGSAPRQVLAQMVLTYAPMLLSYATVALILTLRDQFVTLSERRSPSMFHIALARGAKPYVILTLARIGSRVAVLRGSGPLPALLVRMGMPDPDELISSSGTWEQILVPLSIYSCAFALTFVGGLGCLISVVFWGNISSKLAASVVGRVFKGTFLSYASWLADWKTEIWTKLPTVCVTVLVALGYATCSSLALACGGAIFFLKICSMYEDYLEALVSYSLKVLAGKEKISWQGLFEPDTASPRKRESDEEDDVIPDPTEEGFSMGKLMGKMMKKMQPDQEENDENEEEEKRPGLSQINVHITAFMIYACAFIPCIPELLVWAHNFQYNPRLEQDDMISSLVVTTVFGLNWIHSFPKPNLRYYELMGHFLFGMALFVAMYTPLSVYRLLDFVAVTFVAIAMHQLLAPQEPPPKKWKKADTLNLAIVQRILQEDEITMAGDIVRKPKIEQSSVNVERTASDNTDEKEKSEEKGNEGEEDEMRDDNDIRRKDDSRRKDDDIRGEDYAIRGEDDAIRGEDDAIRGEDDGNSGEDDGNRGKDDNKEDRVTLEEEEKESVVQIQSTRKRKGKKARKVD